MSRWSIRWQLTVWYCLALSFVLLLFSASNYFMIRSYLLTRIDAELDEESDELAEEFELAKSEQEFRRRFQHRYSDEAQFGFQVSQLDGNVLVGSSWLADVALPRSASTSKVNLVLSRGTVRVISRILPLEDGSVMTHVVMPLDHFRTQMRSLASLLIATGLVALFGAIVFGYLVAQRVMVPILNITATAERISSENLSERVSITNANDELGRLATTLNRTFDRLQRSIGEMRRFTADAAHELRTPLAVIRTEAEVALRTEQPTMDEKLESFRHVSEVALAESTRLSILVDQLLTLSRQDAGLLAERQEDVSLRELLLDVVEALRLVADQKQQTIDTSGLTRQIIRGDDISLSQVFFNLIENAVKYTPQGGTITLACHREQSRIYVTVADNGVGIEARHLPHLFKRFYRVDDSRSTRGTGLGLAICRSIIDLHHGELRVASELGKGSTFTVILPALSPAVQSSASDSDVIHNSPAIPNRVNEAQAGQLSN